jgi:hypothetical protein
MRIASVAAASPAHRHLQAVLTEALKEKVLSSCTTALLRRRRFLAHATCPLTYLE